MAHTDYRLPAEWERQSATLLAWPNEGTDWAGDGLPAVQEEYLHLIETILRCQSVVLLVPRTDHGLPEQLQGKTGLHLVEAPFNDTWCRDYGPITLVGEGRRLALDFHFNGWGGKHPAALDNGVNSLLTRHELFSRFTFRQYLFELEGGAIESDGCGHLLVNWHCLHARHPHMSRREIDHELHALLNIDKVLGIDLQPMPGDDTDGHIDTLARFVSPDIVVFQEQADAGRTEELRGQLESLRTDSDKAYELFALPLPVGIDPGLPASYANFLFANKTCLVPGFDSDSDEVARGILADLLPDLNVITVPAAHLIGQSGGPHCAAMHIPAQLA